MNVLINFEIVDSIGSNFLNIYIDQIRFKSNLELIPLYDQVYDNSRFVCCVIYRFN